MNTDLSDDLKHLKEGLVDLQPIGSSIKIAKTSDQVRCLLRCLDLLVSRSQYNSQKKALLQQKSDKFVSITSGRGRGKSALLGLLCAAAIGLGVGRVYVTAPSPENLNPVFKFLISGLEAMKYQQHIDFEIIQRVEKSNQNGANGSPASSNAALRVNVF